MKKIIIAIILLIVAGSLFYYLYWSPVYRLKAMNVIPSNAAFVMASDQPVNSWNDISSSQVWSHLKTNPEFALITDYANYMDSLVQENDWLDYVGNKELLIAALPVQNTYDYAYVMDLSRVSRLKSVQFYLQQILDDSYKVTYRKYKGTDVTQIYDSYYKQTIHICFLENLLVMSMGSNPIEQIINQYVEPQPEDIYLSEVTNEVGYGGMIRVYINYRSFMDYLGQFALENAGMDMLKQSLRYSGFKGNVKNNGISFKGYTNVNDTVNSYLKALYTSGNGSHDFLKIVPTASPYFVSLGFKGFPEFVENLEGALNSNPEQKESYTENKDLTEKFLKIDLNETFVNWVDNEVVMLQTAPSSKIGFQEYAMLIKTKDPEEAGKGLNTIREQIKKRTPIKIRSINYKGYSIRYMAMKGFFKVFLGKLFDKFDKPYYSIVDDWVIFSNHPQTIKNIIDAKEEEHTLYYDDNFRDHYDQLSEKSSVYAYVNMVEIFNDLKPLMEIQEWKSMKKNEEYIKCFSRLSLQLTPEDGNVFKTTFNASFTDPSLLLVDGKTSQPSPQPYQATIQRIPEKELPWERRYTSVLKEIDRIVIPDLSGDEYVEKYDNGKPKYIISIKNGWKHGRFESYFENGEMQFKGRYRDDKKRRHLARV
ncbi:DUF3352 domain-containing protein [Fulvivirga maritima]|uniref:DUF3352 domain-containing protein n=1 Tax=Fulvivirga maritima TaxID=2904247 RepID=UPI001F3E64AE|nr:DUF3352 domain-containing protein [Fulvivirga maritima]UII26269.1 DUF3352 domain-containing protein [Fulvivirga maritima]